MSDRERPLLRKQIILSAILMVTMMGGLAGGLYYRDDMLTQVETLQQRLKSLQDQNRLRAEQTRRLGHYQTRFDAYRAIGAFAQEEPRLRWVEQVLEVEKSLSLPVPLRFKLDVRQPVTPPTAAQKGSSGLFASRMEVTMGLLHEGDLLAFFKRLANRRFGVYDIRSCKMERLHTPAGGRTPLKVEANLTAVCQINWYWYDLPREQEKGGL
ncbi:MAG: hypothetical protein H7838_01505 [Magnetococcus sp. DMHC-8]